MFKKQFSDTEDSAENPKLKDAEDMIACKKCGTHVPKSLSILSDEDHYCCQEHADSKQSSQD